MRLRIVHISSASCTWMYGNHIGMHQLTAVYVMRTCVCARARESKRETERYFIFIRPSCTYTNRYTEDAPRMGGSRAAVKGLHFRCGGRRKILSKSKNRVWIMIKRNERRRDSQMPPRILIYRTELLPAPPLSFPPFTPPITRKYTYPLVIPSIIFPLGIPNPCATFERV